MEIYFLLSVSLNGIGTVSPQSIRLTSFVIESQTDLCIKDLLWTCVCVEEMESGVEEKVRREDCESPVYLRSFNSVIGRLHLVSCWRDVC